MLTFDLHFHANIHRMPERSKAIRLRKLRWHMEHAGLDYLASTEHSYKRPLEAYLRLAEAAEGLKTEIIPGIESVSREGIDVIFLYRGEEALRRALDRLQTFRWSVRDLARISGDTDAVSIVPHPFHIGKSSAGNVLSHRAYLRLLEMSDYIEIHNGSALNVEMRLARSRVRSLFKGARLKLDKTLNLPREDRGKGLGWAISSDAHYPGEQYIVGRTDLDLEPGEAVLDFLKRRIRFDYHEVQRLSADPLKNNTRLLRSFQGVLKEGLVKECVKTRRRIDALAFLGAYYGLFPVA